MTLFKVLNHRWRHPEDISGPKGFNHCADILHVKTRWLNNYEKRKQHRRKNVVKRRSRRASRNESCEISLSLSPSSSLSRVCLVLRPSPLSPIFLCGTSDYSLFPLFGSGKEMPLADGLNVSKLLFFSLFFSLLSTVFNWLTWRVFCR